MNSSNEVVLDRLRRAAQLLRESAEEAKGGGDPIALFHRRLGAEGLSVAVIKKDLAPFLEQFNYFWFFTQVGLTQEMGFFSEIIRRVEERLVPPLKPANDVLWLAHELLDSKDFHWLSRLRVAHLEHLVQLFMPEAFVVSGRMMAQIQESIEVLAQRVSGLGFDPLIARKLKNRENHHRHFLELGRLTFGDRNSFDKSQNVTFISCLKDCESTLSFIRSLRAQEGTSIVLTFRLFLVEELVSRIKLLLNLAQSVNTPDYPKLSGMTFQRILMQSGETIRVGDFLAKNIEILAYQVTILTGHTGEHYISQNGRELAHMWWKAIKGAMVVAVLCFIKVLVAKVTLPPVVQALTIGSIYAAGFVTIHLIGGVLATKQPAMTASTMAAALNGVGESESSMKVMVETVVRLLRTQLAALLGNYLFGFPIAVLLVFPLLVAGHPLADFVKAHHLIEDLHPVWSLSFMYAAIAGVCLFLSGLISGLADNWFDFNQIGIRLKMISRDRRWHNFILKLQTNFGIVLGNIVLGFMLGSMASIGRMTGLPLDIRHVTFASASFGLGWIHLPEMMIWSSFALIAGSVFLMGLINLGVSFSLSLLVAMKAQRLRFSQGRKLLFLVLKHIVFRPKDLFFDPGQAPLLAPETAPQPRQDGKH